MVDPLMIVSCAAAASMLIASTGLAIRFARKPREESVEKRTAQVQPDREAEIALMNRLSDVVGRKYSVRGTDRGRSL